MNSTGFPYSVGVAQAPITHDSNTHAHLDIAAQEEAKSKADSILPYSLEQTNQILANVFVSMLQIRGFISQAENDPSVSELHLNGLISLIDDINHKIAVEIPQQLDILSL